LFQKIKKKIDETNEEEGVGLFEVELINKKILNKKTCSAGPKECGSS
jgi:hypothetical protein